VGRHGCTRLPPALADTQQGKTTTTERMLYHSGRTRHLGSTSPPGTASTRDNLH
jgi:translation elongation factor EF-G